MSDLLLLAEEIRALKRRLAALEVQEPATLAAPTDADTVDGYHAAAFPLLAGRAGGQAILGGTASGDDLTLESTSHATKGDILLQPNGGNVGIGAAAPAVQFEVEGLSAGVSLLRTNSNGAFEGFIRIGTKSAFVAQLRGLDGGGLRVTDGASTTEWARFDTSGNLGIGATTVNAKLEVAGPAILNNGTLVSPDGLAVGIGMRATRAGGVPYLHVEREGTGASANQIGSLAAVALNATPARITFTALKFYSNVYTAAAEVGEVRVTNYVAGTATDVFKIIGADHYIGLATTHKVGFYGVAPVAQRAAAAQAAAPAGGTGATAGAYDTAAHRDSLINLVNEMRTVLVNLGLMKGSA